MKDYYTSYKSEDLWCIKEDGFDSEIQDIRETQFSLGNGYLGVRGSLEEKPKGSKPGTFIAGIYDRLTSQVSELVNFPNPFFFKFIMPSENAPTPGKIMASDCDSFFGSSVISNFSPNNSNAFITERIFPIP